MPCDIPDVEIIKKILEGNNEYCGKLVEKYQNRMFAVISRRVPRNDVEDVAQIAFLKIFRGLADYVPRRPFENWLTVITLRCCYDYWRSAGRRREIIAPPETGTEYVEWLEDISTSASQDSFMALSRKREARELLNYTMSRLDAESRTLVEMVYWEGYSLEQAAEVLNWGLSKTKVRIMRARKKLRKIISGIAGRV
jgi:RNA polymerase sigma-70 factor (ECF subfamily)